ncbi:hypothetical protein D3C73_1180560 [compost metagenome]
MVHAHHNIAVADQLLNGSHALKPGGTDARREQYHRITGFGRGYLRPINNMRLNQGSMAEQLFRQAEYQTDGFAYLGGIMLPALAFGCFTVDRIPDIDHKAPLIPRICAQGLLP